MGSFSTQSESPAWKWTYGSVHGRSRPAGARQAGARATGTVHRAQQLIYQIDEVIYQRGHCRRWWLDQAAFTRSRRIRRGGAKAGCPHLAPSLGRGEDAAAGIDTEVSRPTMGRRRSTSAPLAWRVSRWCWTTEQDGPVSGRRGGGEGGRVPRGWRRRSSAEEPARLEARASFVPPLRPSADPASNPTDPPGRSSLRPQPEGDRFQRMKRPPFMRLPFIDPSPDSRARGTDSRLYLEEVHR